MTAVDAATRNPAADITTHVTIIAKSGTAVTSIDTLTLVLVGMPAAPQPNTTENIVATVTAVVADILNLTSTSVQIAMTDDASDTAPAQIRATVLLQSPPHA